MKQKFMLKSWLQAVVITIMVISGLYLVAEEASGVVIPVWQFLLIKTIALFSFVMCVLVLANYGRPSSK